MRLPPTLGFVLMVSLLVSAAYGAAGSLVVLAVWVYYSAQIFYFGAEFAHVQAQANRNKLWPVPKRHEETA